jgi:hypothetical protein
MRKILLTILLSLFVYDGFSQSLTEFYVGGGCATQYNYNIAPQLGLSRLKRFKGDGRLYLGPQVFYQTYSLYIDNEANSAKKGKGTVGMTERIYNGYVYGGFKFSYGAGQSHSLKVYATASVGMWLGIKQNDVIIVGYDSLYKWDHRPGVTQYDSTIDNFMNQSPYQLRFGVGITKYIDVGRSGFMTFTLDASFISNDLSSTGSISDPGRTAYTVKEIKPGYISGQIGIGHKGRRRRR